MFIFEIIIALLLVGAVLSLWAARLGVPYPALLALTGAAIALIPGMPEVSLDPQLALALFVAPTLLDAAYDASPRDLRDNLVPVISLALGAVGLTIAAVAVLARLFVPAMGWAAAITLGAIVAPPDASAAVAVLRRIAPPHRVSVILEGESLFNDASALLVYRIAAAAAMTGGFSGWSVAPELALTWGGGALAGILLARLFLRLTASVQGIPISILAAVHQHFRRVDLRGAYRCLSNHHSRMLCNDYFPLCAGSYGRCAPDCILCCVGCGGFCVERHGIHSDRAPIARNRDATGCVGMADLWHVRDRCVRGRDYYAYSLGDGAYYDRAMEGSSFWRAAPSSDEVTDVSWWPNYFVVWDARHCEPCDGVGAAERLAWGLPVP